MGFYPHPSDVSRCILCNCHMFGAISSACDVRGVCMCLPGVEGAKCDRCSPRHALVAGRCELCTEGCTGILLSATDQLSHMLHGFNISSNKLLPWERFFSIEDEVSRLRALDFVPPRNQPGMDEVLTQAQQLQRTADQLLRSTTREEARSEVVEEDARDLLTRARRLNARNNIDLTKQTIDDVINSLNER